MASITVANGINLAIRHILNEDHVKKNKKGS